METLDLYDSNGKKLNKTILRGQKPNAGEFIKLVVVYLKSRGLFLLQKCSVEKGGQYAVTGGHVSAGNSSLQQAQIEIQEELGVKIDSSKLRFLGNINRTSAIFDVYLYEDDSLFDFKFSLQVEEVENVYWLTKAQIEDLISQGVVRESSCQHYDKLVKNLK